MENRNDTAWASTVASAAPNVLMFSGPTNRMSSTMLSPVERAMKSSGCLLSPMPRRMAPTQLYPNVKRSPEKQQDAYAAAMSKASPGVRMSLRSGRVRGIATAVSTSAIMRMNVNIVPMERRTASRSFFPWNWEMMTCPAPPTPMLKLLNSMVMFPAEATADRPDVPIYCPTTTVSTSVYTIMRTFAITMGAANTISCFSTLPSVRSFAMVLLKGPVSFCVRWVMLLCPFL